MGALYVKLGISNDYGNNVKEISTVFIWRADAKTNDDDTLTYFASRVAPADIDYEYVDDINFMGTTTTHSYISTPHVTFNHKYSDGAEICLARAILALQEAGMNV